LVVLAGVAGALHVGKLAPAIPALRAALDVTLVQAGFLLSAVQMAGMLLGVLACAALIAGAGPWVQSHYGVALNLGEPSASQGLLLAGVLAAGVLASLIPGLRAYRMSLSDGLSPRS